jgi:hypothetical protein
MVGNAMRGTMAGGLNRRNGRSMRAQVILALPVN